MVERSIEQALPPRTLRVWVQAVRPVMLTASIVPAMLGTAVAATQGLFHPGRFLLILLGATAVQGAANLFGDYLDSRGGGGPPDPYGNGVVLVRGILQPGEVLLAGLMLIALDVAIGVYFTAIRGTPILALWVLSAVGAYFYAGRPVAYKNRALDNPMIVLLFGPLMALAAYYVQAASIELVPMLYALPIGCLAAAILRVNTIPDSSVGGGHGGRTVAPAVEMEGGKLLLYALVGSAYLLVVAGVATGAFVRWSVLALLSAPLAWALVRRVAAANPSQDLAAISAARVHLVFGLLLVIGVLLPAS